MPSKKIGNGSKQKPKQTKKGPQRTTGMLTAPSILGRDRLSMVPMAQSIRFRQASPEFKRSTGGCRIVHREFILDIALTVGFSGFQIDINPGLANAFPWLSLVASTFEKYKFFKCRFVYEPNCPTTTAGYVVQYIDYDSSDTAVTTKVEALASEGATMSAVWMENAVAVNPRAERGLGQDRYVRSGLPSQPIGFVSNTDVRLFDIGKLNIFNSGLGVAGNGGSLFVEYDVELSVPQFNLASKAASNSARLVGATAIGLAKPLGTAPVTAVGSGLIVTPSDDGTNSRITFSTPGQYLLDYVFGGTAITDKPVLSGSTATVSQNNQVTVNAAATQSRGDVLVKINNAGEYLTLDMTGVAATISSCAVKVANYLTTLV